MKPSAEEIEEFDRFIEELLRREDKSGVIPPRSSFPDSAALQNYGVQLARLTLTGPQGITKGVIATFGAGFELGWEMNDAWKEFKAFQRGEEDVKPV
jgi:hypothetical protein